MIHAPSTLVRWYTYIYIHIYIYLFFVRILVSCKLTSPFRTGALPSSGSQPCHSHRCQFRACQYHTWRSARRPWSPSLRSRRKKDTVVGIQIWPKIELGHLHGYMMIYDDILCVYHVCLYIYYASVANLSCMHCIWYLINRNLLLCFFCVPWFCQALSGGLSLPHPIQLATIVFSSHCFKLKYFVS